MVKVLSSPSPVLPSASMSQSGLMVAALLGGFVVFLAMQGKLAAYWSILLGGGSASTAPATTSTAQTPSTPSTSTPSTSTAPSASTSTAPSFPNPFSFLGQTANPTAAGSGTVGFNAFSPGPFSGLSSSGLQLFSGGS